jgi:hypothetical protein
MLSGSMKLARVPDMSSSLLFPKYQKFPHGLEFYWQLRFVSAEGGILRKILILSGLATILGHK